MFCLLPLELLLGPRFKNKPNLSREPRTRRCHDPHRVAHLSQRRSRFPGSRGCLCVFFSVQVKSKQDQTRPFFGDCSENVCFSAKHSCSVSLQLSLKTRATLLVWATLRIWRQRVTSSVSSDRWPLAPLLASSMQNQRSRMSQDSHKQSSTKNKNIATKKRLQK